MSLFELFCVLDDLYHIVYSIYSSDYLFFMCNL